MKQKTLLWILFLSFICVACGCSMGTVNEAVADSNQTSDAGSNSEVIGDSVISDGTDDKEAGNELDLGDPMTLCILPADWYSIAMKTEFVIVEIKSIDVENTIEDENKKYVNCPVDLLGCYSCDEKVQKKLESISELCIPSMYIDEFEPGEIVFAEVKLLFHMGQKTYYKISAYEDERCYTPLIDGKLIFSEEFKNTDIFQFLMMYNESVTESLKSEGEVVGFQFSPNLFHEGMDIEELKEFFEVFKVTEKNYEEYLDYLKNTGAPR